MSDQNNTASKTPNQVHPSSSPVSTATLAAATGVPGWEIQSGGRLSAVPVDNGTSGMSLVGFGQSGTETSATADAPKSIETTNGSPTNSDKNITHHPPRHVIDLVIVACALSVAMLLGTFVAIYFLRRARRRRLESFSRRTSELQRQSTINAINSKSTKITPATSW